MKNKIITATLSILIGLTMLVAVVPIGASLAPEQVSAPYEFFAYVKSNIDVGTTNFYLTSEMNPSILYYDFDEGDGKEVLNFTIDGPNREINGDPGNFLYETSIYMGGTNDNEPYIAWIGQPYYVVENGSDWYLSQLLVDEDEDDTHLLRVGESLALAEGFAISPQEIDVDGGEAWFSVTQDGEEVESSVTKEDKEFMYEADLNESGEEDNWVLKFSVETVFAGMNTNLVKINSIQLISPDVLKIETPDDDTFSNFEITSQDNYQTLRIELDDADDEISLKKDGIVSFLGDRFWFRINEDGDVGGLVVRITEPGTYELFAAVETNFDTEDAEFNLTSKDHPSILYYDFDEGEGEEEMHLLVDHVNREINGESDNFLYETAIYQGGTNDNEPYIAWLGQPYYVVENSSDWYLSKLLVDEDSDDTHLLRVGESLALAEGFAIAPQEIDVDGGEAWFSITQDGEEVESSVAKEDAEFLYEADLNESGEEDNRVLKFNIETVFAGMNTNLVKINSIQLISPDVLKVETPDDDTFSNFEITSQDNYNTLRMKLDNTDDEISLKKDGIVDFLGRFWFRINEDGDVGGICKVVEVGGDGVVTDTEPGDNVTEPGDNETAGPTDTGVVDGTATEPGKTPEPTETEKEPGFEAVFAIAGLLAVAYLVLRKRE